MLEVELSINNLMLPCYINWSMRMIMFIGNFQHNNANEKDKFCSQTLVWWRTDIKCCNAKTLQSYWFPFGICLLNTFYVTKCNFRAKRMLVIKIQCKNKTMLTSASDGFFFLFYRIQVGRFVRPISDPDSD